MKDALSFGAAGNKCVYCETPVESDGFLIAEIESAREYWPETLVKLLFKRKGIKRLVHRHCWNVEGPMDIEVLVYNEPSNT